VTLASSDDYINITPETILEYIDEVAAQLEDAASMIQISLTKHPHKGLSEAWVATPDKDGITLINDVRTTNGESYASYWLEGRGPVIASPGKVLHFVNEKGADIFTKRVGPAPAHPAFIDNLSRWVDINAGSIFEDVIKGA
jgi:hypothetical protein